MSLLRPVLSVLLVASLGLAGCLEDPPPPASSVAADPKEEALAFSLRVVETYFTQDYATFRGMLADTLYTLEGEGPFTPAQVDEWNRRERPFPSGRDYSNHTMAEYLATYAPKMMTWEEVRAAYPEVDEVTWQGWAPDGDDLVFFGAEVKEGREPFLWDDLLAFAVTKETGEWRFKAFSG